MIGILARIVSIIEIVCFQREGIYFDTFLMSRFCNPWEFIKWLTKFIFFKNKLKCFGVFYFIKPMEMKATKFLEIVKIKVVKIDTMHQIYTNHHANIMSDTLVYQSTNQC
jgi:hypothetical protein